MDLYCWCSFMVPKQYFSWSTILHLVFLENLVTFWNRNRTTKVHKLKYTSILVAAPDPLNYTRAENTWYNSVKPKYGRIFDTALFKALPQFLTFPAKTSPLDFFEGNTVSYLKIACSKVWGKKTGHFLPLCISSNIHPSSKCELIESK